MTHLFAKTAILIEWMQLFTPHRIRPWFYWSAWAVLTINAMLYVSSIIAASVTCIPLEAYWSRWIPGSCINFRIVTILSAFFNTFVDVIILLLPQGIIWRLNVDRSRKIGVSLIFSVGLLAVACSAGRVASTFGVEFEGDGSYTMSPVFMWALTELSCVLLVFCLPAIPKAFTETETVTRILRSARSWAILRNMAHHNNHSTVHDTTKVRSKRSHSISASNIELGHIDQDDGRSDDRQPLQDPMPPLPTRIWKAQPANSPVIMKTTDFERHVVPQSGPLRQDGLESQHPWMQRK